MAYYEEFEKPKIVYAEIATTGQFTLDKQFRFCDTTAYILGNDSVYLLGILNSRLWNFVFRNVSSEIRGGFLRWKRQYMAPLPIRTIDFSNPADKAAHDRMTGMVEAMLELQEQKAAQKATASGDALIDLNARIAQLDASIDALVYELYGLTEEEIGVVEAAVAG